MVADNFLGDETEDIYDRVRIVSYVTENMTIIQVWCQRMLYSKGMVRNVIVTDILISNNTYMSSLLMFSLYSTLHTFFQYTIAVNVCDLLLFR